MTNKFFLRECASNSKLGPTTTLTRILTHTHLIPQVFHGLIHQRLVNAQTLLFIQLTPLPRYAIPCPLTLLAAGFGSFTDDQALLSSWIFRERPTRARFHSLCASFLPPRERERERDCTERAVCTYVCTQSVHQSASQRFDLPPVSIVANAGTGPATGHLGSSQSLLRPRGRRECSLLLARIARIPPSRALSRYLPISYCIPFSFFLSSFRGVMNSGNNCATVRRCSIERVIQ